MAKIVGYWNDNVTFEEGPFVLCNALGAGFRIEAEIANSETPVLPHLSIYKLLESQFGDSNKGHLPEEMHKRADWLNSLVKKGHIVLKDGLWVVGVN